MKLVPAAGEVPRKKRYCGIVIEYGIPIPPLPKPGPKLGFIRNRYPFERMRVGGSFLIKCIKLEAMRCQANVIGASYKYKGEFTTRRVKDGIRVWRVK